MLAHMARTRKGGFRYRIFIPYRRSLFFTPNASENASRTPGACFLNGTHIPYRRRPSPVPNSANARKEESIACTECFKRQKGEGHGPEHVPECRREQENHSLRPQNTPANSTTTQRPTTATHPATHSANKKHHQHPQSPPQAVRKVRFSKCNRPSGLFWQG